MPVDTHNTAALKSPFVELFIGGPATAPYRLLDAGTTLDTEHRKFLLMSMSYHLTSRAAGVNRMNLTILDPTWDSLEELISEEVTKREIGVRFGWRSADQQFEDSSAVVEMYVYDWNVELKPFAGAVIHIQLYDRTVELNHYVEAAGFRPDTKISVAIAQLINSISGLNAEVVPTANTVGTQHARPNQMTAAQYLDKLLAVAVSEQDGLNGYTMRTVTEGGVKVLKVGPVYRSANVVRAYIFGRFKDSEIISFNPAFTGAKTLGLGGGRYAVLAVDPQTKQLMYEVSQRNEDVVTAPNQTQGVQNTTRTEETADANRQNMKGAAHEHRYNIDLDAYPADAQVMGDPSILPSDLIRILVLKGQTGMQDQTEPTRSSSPSALHRLSGFYRVDDMMHTIEPGMFRTMLHLHRTSELEGKLQVGTLLQVPVRQVPANGGGVVLRAERPSNQ